MKTLVQQHRQESNKDSHFIPRMIVMAASAAVLAYCLAVMILNVDIKTLAYHETGDVNYQVCLKPNNYFADACQPAGKQYVASLIDRLETELNYSFQIDDTVKYDYTYDISSKLIATESNDSDKILYENEDVILPSKTVSQQTGQSFNLNEKIEIDYDKYNSLITAFRADYGLTIEANLIISLNVKVKATSDGFSERLDVSQQVALKVPLSERTINVTVEADQLSNNGQMEEKTHNLARNLLFVAGAGASGLVFVVVLGLSVVIFIRRENGRSTYEKQLGRILHEYNQLIVAVEHLPEIPRSKLIEVSDFDELLNARDTIQQPILHLTISDDSSLFAIEDGSVAYVFALSAKTLAAKEKTHAKSKTAEK
jgi:hypothetical protein